MVRGNGEMARGFSKGMTSQINSSGGLVDSKITIINNKVLCI
jgi:hypothetical protein